MDNAHYCDADQQEYHLGIAIARATLAATESVAAMAASIRDLHTVLRERLPEQLNVCECTTCAEHLLAEREAEAIEKATTQGVPQ